MEFTPAEQAILAQIQGDLPHSLTPFADLAQKCGASEAEVLALLRKLKASGAIRRFGASLRHQQAGWRVNAMCAWVATREQADICGPIAARFSNISHVYFRPSSAPDWPYTFYTMLHAHSDVECAAIVEQLARELPLTDYIVLETTRELKKISPTYFHLPGESANG